MYQDALAVIRKLPPFESNTAEVGACVVWGGGVQEVAELLQSCVGTQQL
jgi:hypothetical protein